MIIQKPLTPEQREQLQTVSQKDILAAQDALFMFLLQRVAELEKRLDGDGD